MLVRRGEVQAEEKARAAWNQDIRYIPLSTELSSYYVLPHLPPINFPRKQETNTLPIGPTP